jgi:hypothetical protein
VSVPASVTRQPAMPSRGFAETRKGLMAVAS